MRKWKRPRGFALPAIVAGILVAIGLIAAVAIAALVTDSGTHDLTVADKINSSGLVDIGNASVEYIGSVATNQSSGTGIFDPFVRLQGEPNREGLQHRRACDVRYEAGELDACHQGERHPGRRL